MKKIPLAFSGCLLGLGGAGNLLADSLPLLGHAFSLTGLLLWFSFFVYHVIRWPTSRSFIWDGHFSHGRDDFIDLSSSSLSHLCRSISVGLVVRFPFGSVLDSLLYQDSCHGATKGQGYSELDGSLCGDCSGSLDLPSGRSDGASLSYPGGWICLDLMSVSADLSRFENESFTESLIGTRRHLLCSFFSSFSCFGSSGGSGPSFLGHPDHVSHLASILFLCFDAPSENDERRFSTCFFSSDLSNSYHSDLFENGPRLVATTFLDSSRMAGNSSLSLDFSRCLRWLCGLSQRVGRHPFSLKPCHDYGKMHYTICQTL